MGVEPTEDTVCLPTGLKPMKPTGTYPLPQQKVYRIVTHKSIRREAQFFNGNLPPVKLLEIIYLYGYLSTNSLPKISREMMIFMMLAAPSAPDT
jgi:hypothetical protein